LAVGILQVKNGATFAGNMSLGSGLGLHVDDQSTVCEGTISETGSSQVYVSSTINGAPETVQLPDAIVLGNNGTLTISGDPGITVALTGAVSGAGTLLTPGSNVAVDGTLQASGGTLSVGALSGTGTLMTAAGSDLVLQGATSSSLTATIATGGTLTIATSLQQFRATIFGFAPGENLIVSANGVTGAEFTASSPGTGLLDLLDGSQQVGQIALSGVQAGETFSVSSRPNGTIAITANAASVQQNAYVFEASGSLQPTNAQIMTIAPQAQTFLNEMIAHNPTGNNEWFLAGDTTVVGGAPAFGVDLEVVGSLTQATSGQGLHVGSNVTLAVGYHALIAEGSENINLLDSYVGNSLIAGNTGADILVTACNNDTLVGASGANTVFFAGSQATGQNVIIQGGGNDTISTGNDNALITTSSEHSFIFLGTADDTVNSSGHDEIVCAGGSGSQVKVSADATAQDTVFGPQSGSMTFTGSTEAATVVGGGGAITMTGGATNGNILFSGTSDAKYTGGNGSAIVVGGSGNLQVTGGVGAIDVWGGTGNTTISGASGKSVYVVGDGAATVSAATGNLVWVQGEASVSVIGANGVEAYGGTASGNNTFRAAAGSETLWGGAGNDTFFAGNSGSGESYFVSGGGNDQFDFVNGATGGTNVIDGFIQGQDMISLSGYGDTVPSVSVQNGSSYFQLGDGSQVEVYGVTNLTASAFHVS
jgi:Ca2+-binding RTX toxin-like protein